MSLKSGIGFRGPNQTLSALAQAVGYVAELPTFAHKVQPRQTGCRMWIIGDGSDNAQIAGALWVFNPIAGEVSGLGMRTGFMAMPIYVLTAASTLLSTAVGAAYGIVTASERFCDQITTASTTSATTPKGPGAATPLGHGLGFGNTATGAFTSNSTTLSDVPAQIEMFCMGGAYAYGWELVKPSGGTHATALYVPILEDRDAR